MSDGTISQDEIDALLKGVDSGGLGAVGVGASSSGLDVSALQPIADGLKDKFAATLNSMTGAEFTAGAPTVEALTRDQMLAKLPEDVVTITNDFSAGLSGDHVYAMTQEFATKLTALINGEENPALDDMAFSVISEVVSSHSGSENTDLSAGGKFPGLATNPCEASTLPKAMVRIPNGDFALITYTVSLEGTEYTLWEMINGNAVKEITKAFGPDDVEELGSLSPEDMGNLVGNAGGAPGMGDMGGMNMGGAQMGGMPNMGMGGMNMGMGAQMGGMPNMGMGMPQMGMPNMGMGGMNPAMMGMNVPNVQALQYPNLQQGGMPQVEGQGNISLLMDVFMEMTVELGRTQKQIKEILGMGEGTIIELDKLAGEPVDILVNHKAIAKGEVVVIDENFGVRVTEILSPMERVSDLH